MKAFEEPCFSGNMSYMFFHTCSQIIVHLFPELNLLFKRKNGHNRRPYAKRALTAFGHSEIIAFKGFGLSNNQKFVVVFLFLKPISINVLSY